MKNFLITPLVLLALAVPAYAEKIPLARLSGYLNSLKTAQTEFTQINEDGSVSSGEFYLKRPGRVRFEYDAPNESLVIAGGSKVAIFDHKSNSLPQQFPLKRTPLNLILARNVNLGRSNMVIDHRDDGKFTTVVAQDPEHPEYGYIELKFTAKPLALRQWVITNDAGGQTVVNLQDLAQGIELRPSLFNIIHEIERRGLN